MFGPKTLSLALLGASAAFAKYIVPGGRWVDTEGNLVNAHAGGVVFEEGNAAWATTGGHLVVAQESKRRVLCIALRSSCRRCRRYACPQAGRQSLGSSATLAAISYS